MKNIARDYEKYETTSNFEKTKKINKNNKWK